MLTEEQRARIERNRQEALAKRARMTQQQQQQQTAPPQQQTAPPQQQTAPPQQHQTSHAAGNQHHGGPSFTPAGPSRPPPQQYVQQGRSSRPSPEVPVVMVDACEAAIIEQAMMAAQRPLHQPQQQQRSQHPTPTQPNTHGQPQWQQQRLPNAAQPKQKSQIPSSQQQQQKTPANQPPPVATGPPVIVSLSVTSEGMFKAICLYNAGVCWVGLLSKMCLSCRPFHININNCVL